MAQQQPGRFAWVEGSEADVTLTVNGATPLVQWVYAVAAPFATVADEVTTADLQSAWQSGAGLGWPLFLDAATAAAFTAQWGQPGPTAHIVAETDVSAALWANRPSWSILPFDRLTPDLKVLRLEGRSPLDSNFDLAGYPLVLSVGVNGDEAAVGQFLAAWSGPATNRDPGKLTRLAMTGVTALTRATAYQMELNGIAYPGTAVAPALTTADIAHVSNEVSFAPDCPYPNPIGGTTFCSRDSYFTLLQELGIDVVELTGNHVNDWGAANLLHSLDLYQAAGMAYFGGGRDLVDAAEPAFFSHNGNQIAFVGCNPVGPAYAWASAATGGARPCDAGFYSQIGQLQAEGYLVIATLQYYEFYHYAPTTQQQVDFQATAAAGAMIVSGSQGHHAQGFAFAEGAFIHYGLGNLFFDQMDMLGTRQTFVDTHVIYDGRLLSVELWTGLIENWARPRLMTPAERAQLLTAVFQASGW
jgi:poly-gamma-glutamate synthesis protein (capsule biosynthesis protein)